MTLSPQSSLQQQIDDLVRRVAALESRQPPSQGASGTITLPLLPMGYVTPMYDTVNVRAAPTLLAGLTDTLVRGDVRPVTGEDLSLDNDGHIWYQINPTAYVRDDVVAFSVDRPTPAIIAPVTWARWDAPVKGTITSRHGVGGHRGVDLATGALRPPVYAGFAPGMVTKAFTCMKCDPNGTPGQRTVSNAYGYGSHVIVRYEFPILPSGIREALVSGTHLFIMYAHLSAINVAEGQALVSGQEIGHVGSTGDSTGNHLHLECRVSSDLKAKWSAIEGSGIDPARVFVL